MKLASIPNAARLILPIALLACSESTAGPSAGSRAPLSLSFSTKSFKPSASVDGAFRVAGDIVIGAANELVIKKVEVVLRRAELSKSEGGNCDGDGDFQCEDIETAPTLASLPLTAGAKTVVTVQVTPGTYSRLDVEIGAPETSNPGTAAFVAANPAFKDKSLRVEGTYKGVPFVFYALLNADLEMKLNPPLAISVAGPNNITVDVDIARWFKNAAGAALDPSLAANASPILANIRASFRAFEDDNQDGENDQVGDNDGDNDDNDDGQDGDNEDGNDDD